jgi:hypothetical protein
MSHWCWSESFYCWEIKFLLLGNQWTIATVFNLLSWWKLSLWWNFFDVISNWKTLQKSENIFKHCGYIHRYPPPLLIFFLFITFVGRFHYKQCWTTSNITKNSIQDRYKPISKNTKTLLYWLYSIKKNSLEEGFCVFRNGLISISDWVFGSTNRVPMDIFND